MTTIPVIIFCGGQGTRMRGDTPLKKELVPVGGKPIIWHVMRIFAAYGHTNFILTLGYEADQIRDYFRAHAQKRVENDTIIFNDGSLPESWRVTLVDTGLFTVRAQRVAQVAHLIKGERFFMAFGDDVSDVDLKKLVAFHVAHGKAATITGVQVRSEFGIIEANADGLVRGFVEKPKLPHWINGGYMLFEAHSLPQIERSQSLVGEMMPQLAAENELMVYRHHGFWHSMNTLKDRMALEEMWQDDPQWRVWEE